MKVCKVGKWPPKPEGARDASHELPSPDEAIIYRVIYCRREWLTFVCEFGKDLYTYDFEAHDTNTCEALKRILDENVGKSLASIGELKVTERPVST
jgi:hypothetical protein